MVVENFSNSIKMKSVSFGSISRSVWLSFSAQHRHKCHRRWNVKWMLDGELGSARSILNPRRVNVRGFHCGKTKEWVGRETMGFRRALKTIERIVFELRRLWLKWSKTPTENFLMKIHNNKCGPSGYYWRVFPPSFYQTQFMCLSKSKRFHLAANCLLELNRLCLERDSKEGNIFVL